MELTKIISVESTRRDRLRNLAFELDSNLGCLGGPVSILVDVEIELSNYICSMESKNFKETINYLYDEHFRKIRLLSEIMHHTVKELADIYVKTELISESMFNEVVDKATV
ncbi:MAG: hypothetical protein K0S34_1479 [Bacillales bacterium]|jgi:NADPH-dependent 7-cyano-7-deazaguanine reductase QueF-like protein|nr:hypothetical protein [Bacillales bacterium]